MAKRKAKSKRVELVEVVACFESLEDPRSSINRRHPLTSVLTISLMAVLAGADGPAAIRTWAEGKKDWLLEMLSLPFELPSQGVFRRVLMALQPQAFHVCFVEWLHVFGGRVLRANGAAANSDRAVMAIDSKTLRGSHGLGVWSVYSTEPSDREKSAVILGKLNNLNGNVRVHFFGGDQITEPKSSFEGAQMATCADQKSLVQHTTPSRVRQSAGLHNKKCSSKSGDDLGVLWRECDFRNATSINVGSPENRLHGIDGTTIFPAVDCGRWT